MSIDIGGGVGQPHVPKSLPFIFSGTFGTQEMVRKAIHSRWVFCFDLVVFSERMFQIVSLDPEEYLLCFCQIALVIGPLKYIEDSQIYIGFVFFV